MGPLFLAGLGIALIAFAVVWAICVRVNNYGFLDVTWSYSVAALAPLYAYFSPGYAARKWPLAILGAVWSLRLGTYILLRVLRHHPKEDARYQTLRDQWKGPGMFFLFFELQAVIAAIFSLPFLFTSFDLSPSIHPLAIAGALVSLVSVIGETVSDIQMQRFKADPSNRDRICEVGLWRYSRHPNYFFESMVWWGFFLAALPSPFGWATIVCPLLMLFFLFRVTGIPLTEEYSIRSKGDLYRAYQRTTSPFIPWFRKT